MPTRFDSPLLKKGNVPPPTTEELVDLLRRAADSLQSYCANENGDMNDALAMQIEQTLSRIPKVARSKKAYGYDVSGESQSQSGSGGNQKNVEESNGSQPQDAHGSPKNPANFMHDDAAEEFPEVNRPSKKRFLAPRGLR